VQLTSITEALEADLTAIAAVGDDAVAAAANRLAQALRASIGMRLLDLLGEAALELSAQLPSGHVEVRLAGQDPSLVYVAEEEADAPQPADDGLTARISLRLPESLKGAVEVAASREGISVNAWLVRALHRSVTSSPPLRHGHGGRLTGYGKS
jgi:predicted HicB family RNase H-like nuclease